MAKAASLHRRLQAELEKRTSDTATAARELQIISAAKANLESSLQCTEVCVCVGLFCLYSRSLLPIWKVSFAYVVEPPVLLAVYRGVCVYDIGGYMHAMCHV